MKSKASRRRALRARRHARIQKKVRGTTERPRLVVSRSLRNMQGQVVDDDRGRTVIGVSTLAPAVAEHLEEAEGYTANAARSWAAGRLLAQRALDAGVENVVFDRGGLPYHGRVKAFAEGARAGGLRF